MPATKHILLVDDEKRIREVVEYALAKDGYRNAQRFSPEGVPVSVVVTGPGDDDLFTIQVTDRGPGILPEHFPRVFDRFFTTDAERDGTGLGLAIVKSVASAHGGQVSFTSEPGCTCFSLQLPSGFVRQRRPRA